jgi:uncharacterized protein YbjQ (UPF0145 family)
MILSTTPTIEGRSISQYLGLGSSGTVVAVEE